jgi:AbrB family looped-hinge helix DNA binding protein
MLFVTGWMRARRPPSNEQVTIPKSVRDALELHEGDELLFRGERSRAVIAKTPSFLDLAASVPFPAGKRGTPWDAVLRHTRADRAVRQR